MSKWYFLFAPSLKWGSPLQMEIMKKCIIQNFLFQNIPWYNIEFIDSFWFWFNLITHDIGIFLIQLSFIHSFDCLILTLIFFLHCILNIWAWRYNTNPWFETDWLNFLENEIMDYLKKKKKWTINLYSCCLSIFLYILVISILFDTIAFLRLGEKLRQIHLTIMRSYNLDYGRP